MIHDRVLHKGKEYIAVESIGCKGCAFNVMDRACYSVRCSVPSREDRTSVVYKPVFILRDGKPVPKTQ